MQSSVPQDHVAHAKPEVATIVTHRSLRDADSLRNALLSDIPKASFGDALRALGLERVSFWIQRDPDASVVMWEGAEIDTLLERFEASPDPVLARWRGQLRMWSGPEEADSFWEGSRHRLLSWATDEQGAESVVTIYRDPRQVEAYRRHYLDIQGDPSLLRLLDRVRRRQGFTRIEAWHQHSNGNDIVLTLVEAHDLDVGMAQFTAEDNELDRRVTKLLRSTILQPLAPPPEAKLLARWRA